MVTTLLDASVYALDDLADLYRERWQAELNLRALKQSLQMDVLRDHIAAISCGVHGGVAVLDLDYAEDSQADTDANFVLTGTGNIVEIQATAEKTPFSEEQFAALLALARKGIGKLVDLQKMAVG